MRTLEHWEERTRTPGKMGRRRSHLNGANDNAEQEEGEGELSEIFKDGRWDSGKMVKTFARFGTTGKGDVKVASIATEEVSGLQTFFLQSQDACTKNR